MNKNTPYIIILSVLAVLVVSQVTIASEASIFNYPQKVRRVVAQTTQTTQTDAVPMHAKPDTQDVEEKINCDYEKPDKPEYKASFIASRKKGVVAQGEVFENIVYIRNMGNTPWFSADSGCSGPKINLGTDKDRDRESIFFTNTLLWESGWSTPNRIHMDSKRVDPGKLAMFKFWSRAPQEDGYYREIYTPVAEGQRWMEGGTATNDIRVGEGMIPPGERKYLKYIQKSTNLSKFDLSGEKLIEVSISQQKMRLKIGDYVIKEFSVSTGKASTPTPYGSTKIFQKQEVRVAGGYPHYIMPKWMQFRPGYGIHALPSLANDRGVFWREALNHIGTRRSHGCIRLLPNDAAFTYEFGDIGTTLKVVK